MRSRACAPLSPWPPRRYLTTSSRARTAWEISSSIGPAPNIADFRTPRLTARAEPDTSSPSNGDLVEGPADGHRELCGGGRAAEIARPYRTRLQHAAQRAHDA